MKDDTYRRDKFSDLPIITMYMAQIPYGEPGVPTWVPIGPDVVPDCKPLVPTTVADLIPYPCPPLALPNRRSGHSRSGLGALKKKCAN